jgi:serine/threonine protein kinase/Flp pilus assembly protein TadD
MATEPGDLSERDRRLGELVIAYVKAGERGEAPAPHEWLAAHAEFAEELADFLAEREDLDRLAGPLRAVARGNTPPPSPGEGLSAQAGGPAQLGGFRLRREVGRGGMGVVYEAEQLSLGRRVALKVLPFAATLDARQLQRFKNEAQAAAGLQHPNIVPVYYVGCERGLHYYAMQYIDGRTLAAVIAELRRDRGSTRGPDAELTTPYAPGSAAPRSAGEGSRAVAGKAATVADRPSGAETAAGSANAALRPAHYRWAAGLGEQAALGLEHAHQLGVVHRDVKPANLLLDGRGNLWVTDFGLAQVQSDHRLTRTGDLVGTLRYMSPEQALGKRLAVDHRADVYSLGATLYELLTLRPALEGHDRQALLRQIAFGEPRRLRSHDRGIPPELETIVLKALAKNPDERYPTAQALADDLRRFLEDRPIQARRPGPVKRLRKWCRRHKAVVGGAASTLVVGLAVLAGSVGWVARDQAARRAEMAHLVGRLQEDASTHQENGRIPEALARLRQAHEMLAATKVDPALAQEVQGRLADLELVDRLQRIRLEAGTGVRDGHFDWQERDRQYGQCFAAAGLDVEARPDEAVAHIRASTVAVEVTAAIEDWSDARGETRGPHDASWKALLRAACLADPDPWRTGVRQAELAGDRAALWRLTAAADVARLPPTTLASLAAALRSAARASPLRRVKDPRGPTEAFLRAAQRQHPGDFWLNMHLSLFYNNDSRPPRPTEAVRFAAVAVGIRPDNAGAHSSLGTALHRAGRLDDAIDEYRQAVRLQPDFAEVHCSLASSLYEKGLLDEAIAELRATIRLKKGWALARFDLGAALHAKGRLDEAVAKYHEAIGLGMDDAKVHHNLGNALLDQRRLDDAITEFRAAIRRDRNLDLPHASLGIALHDKGRLKEAISEYQEAVRLNDVNTGAHSNLGDALRDSGRLDEAITEYGKAIRQKDYAETHYGLANALREKGRPKEAIAEYRHAVRLKPGYADAHYNLGKLLRTQGRLKDAGAAYREAIRYKPDYAEAHCNLGGVLLAQGNFREAVEEYRRGHELGTHDPRWPYPSAEWLRQAETMARLDERLGEILAGRAEPQDAAERLNLARLCLQSYKARYAAAARWYAEVFSAQPGLADDLNAGHRYDAACAAARAGCGQSKDADRLNGADRAHLRGRARDWLRAELAAYARALDQAADRAAPAVAARLGYWLKDKDLAGVRSPPARAGWSDAERREWQQLWQDVEALRRRAAARPGAGPGRAAANAEAARAPAPVTDPRRQAGPGGKEGRKSN